MTKFYRSFICQKGRHGWISYKVLVKSLWGNEDQLVKSFSSDEVKTRYVPNKGVSAGWVPNSFFLEAQAYLWRGGVHDFFTGVERG
jgi:hypothetical protein